MITDQMRDDFEAWAESQDCIAHRGEGGSYWHPDVRKAWKVWQAAYAAGRKAEQAEVERLRGELAAANTKTHAERQNRTVEVDGAVRLLKESREEVERLRAELAAAGDGDTWREACWRVEKWLEKTRAELAAAKAASVCPVRVKDCFSFGQNVEVECYCEDDADRLSGWLNERIKGGEG